MLHLYKFVEVNSFLLKKLQHLLEGKLTCLKHEICYNIELEDNNELTDDELSKLRSILQLFNHKSSLMLNKSYFDGWQDDNFIVIEIGPRLNQKTPFCTNALSICKTIDFWKIKGIEVSWRYLVTLSTEWKPSMIDNVVNLLHDPMTQRRYYKPLNTLQEKFVIDNWFKIDVSYDNDALKLASNKLGLAFDDWDLKFYSDLFNSKLKRNPTSVECFDLAQSNSEHSRHWFFKGKMFIDDREQPKCLFKMVTDTLLHSNKNNKIAFHDNGSAIEGFKVVDITTETSVKASKFLLGNHYRHLTLTAETHNFPTGVAPFPGAATGTGGRQRDQHAIGQGSGIVAGTCGYCVGNLHITNFPLPWEQDSEWAYPTHLAHPCKVIIDASDGASDYGNKFGEPVVSGFFRSFGMKLVDGERIEWLKPIMFSGGIGNIDDRHLNKVTLEKSTSGLLVAKIGGPAYRIGVGGGCASSLMHGQNNTLLDFNAVQRGDAEMQQKLHRVVKACYEHENNPILSIHDQGAGGNGNVLKEIVDPSGALIYQDSFTLGDHSLSTQELWTAEYQESDAILLDKKDLTRFKEICNRERCTVDVVGQLNGSGKIILTENSCSFENGIPVAKSSVIGDFGDCPVNLDLELVLGKMPQRHFYLETISRRVLQFDTSAIGFIEALNLVLRLPSVASKRFLTNKVDRSVTGLIAQQQCTGPLHTPISDVAVTALSYFETVGTATAIGEQPVKMLVDAAAGARMAVGESLTNIVFAAVSTIRDIKCSANWMWPAKLPGEGARLFRACQAMCEVMKEVGIAVDGGKDSLSMAANVDKEIVKSPGSLVISLYAPCVDITCTVTPDLKCPGGIGWLVYVPMSTCKPCLGGSALAQCHGQIGDQVSDLDNPKYFVEAWNATQQLIKTKQLLSGHDISDGGFITCVLEMAFAGNCGLDLCIEFPNYSEIEFLFAENLGVILETKNPELVVDKYKSCGISAMCIGKSIKNAKISLAYNGKKLIDCVETSRLRDVWESTSFALELLQCDEECVRAEREWLLECDSTPRYEVTFDTLPLSVESRVINVAVLREEGSNGDREMAAAFYTAGFQPWDVTMQDLIDGNLTLDRFRGLVFVGGFSYADVFGSAKGWASCCLYNNAVRSQLEAFKARNDVFSLGVCNGCQLMALLGWIGEEKMPCAVSWCENMPPLFLGPNSSGRFESRFVTVKIGSSKAVMLKNMEGSQLGIWVAHGEGKFYFNDSDLLNKVVSNNLIPLRYVDCDGNATERYPMNPNGSPLGIAGLCSSDGRHLAVMPHPERCFQAWQWPYKPPAWRNDTSSPWLQMFENALQWCLENE